MKFAPYLFSMLTVLLPTAAALAASQEPGIARAWEHQSSDLEVDPRIQFGQLDNGFRYAWMKNAEPQNRCYMRLHIDVGALAEEDDENGMAHFLEHMAFNGSEHFPSGTLIEWFQEHGMDFGADLNAITTYSETIYKLDLPHSNEETLREGLTVLRDWADGLSIEEEEIAKEKGVIDGEDAAGDTAGRRVREQLFTVQYTGTRYTLRDVIGDKETRAAFDAAGVRAFYERWYRPEVMTLAIVGDLGDLDPSPIVKEFFAGVAVPEHEIQPEPALGKAEIKERFFAIHEAEIPNVSVSLEQLKLHEEEPDNRDTRTDDLDLACARRMLNLRFSELMKKEDAPFLQASVAATGGLKIYDGESLRVSAVTEEWEEGYLAAHTELRRALAFGFQPAELEEVRANWLRALDEAVERESTRNSRGFVSEIVSAAEERYVPTSAKMDRDLLRPIIEKLDVKACHDAFVEAWSEGVVNLYTVGNLDLGDGASETLRSTYERAEALEVEKGDAVEADTFAYASDPETLGKVTAEKRVEDLDVELLTFENGVRVNLKMTDFKEREILMLARVAEGLLTLAPEEFAVGWLANRAVGLAGLGAHTTDDLRRLTAGKQVGVGFGWNNEAFILQGSTTQEDLVMQLELLCASLTDPGWRDDGVRLVRDRIPLIFEQLLHVPQGPLYLEFLPELFHHDPRFSQIPERARLESVEMEHIQAWLAPHLAKGPVDVTLVGDFELEATKQAVAQTLGVLPARRARQAFEERRRVAAPKAGLRSEATVDSENNKSLVFIAIPTADGIDTRRRRELATLGLVVQDRLRIEVREKLGAAYSPSANSSANETFPGVGMLTIQATLEPEDVSDLVDGCLRVVKELQENGVTQEECDRVVEPSLAQIRDAKRTNGFWLGTLAEAQSKPSTLDDIRSIEAFYEDIDAERISSLAAQYLKPVRASVLIVNPATADESKVQEAGAEKDEED